MEVANRVAPSEIADWLLARGRMFVTTAEVADLVGADPGSVPASLQRSRESGRMVSVTKGAWAAVPPEYRAAGGPPPIQFIDPLMTFLGHKYYVGFLSAARLHGAAHQAPMVLQIATPALLRSRHVGGGRIQFVQRSTISSSSTQRVNVPTGRVTAATVEATLLDLVADPRLGGGLSNVATVIADLLEDDRIDIDRLAIAANAAPLAVIQRLGYLIDLVAGASANSIDTAPLAKLILEADYAPLQSGSPRRGERDHRWKVTINSEVEPDL
jgi:predicted transcriptional regulator of viral defense system